MTDVYQFGPDHTYHLVPNVATADAMGIKWGQLHAMATVSPVGLALPGLCSAASTA